MTRRLFVILLAVFRVWNFSVSVDDSVFGTMSVRSLPAVESAEQGNVRNSVSEPGFKSPVQLRGSSRTKQPSKLFGFESYRAERARTLFHSRSGYVGTLTKLQGVIQQLMDQEGGLEDLKLKQKAYDDVWRKFVNTHEEYVECLELIDYAEELEKARVSYKEQMARKLKFDSKIESWKSERDQGAMPLSRKSSRTSRSSSSSSVSLALAKKREQLALAQLKTTQVLREQELKRKMSELQYAKEIMEAQMEEERATVSLNVFEEVDRQGTRANGEDHKERLAEFVPEDANVGGALEVDDNKTSNVPVIGPPMEELPAVKPFPVIQEPSTALPRVKTECGRQAAIEHQKTCPQTVVEHLKPELPKPSLPVPSECCNQDTTCLIAEHLPVQAQLPRQGVAEDIARALGQIVSMPKVEYMRFDGDPIKYVSFIHNFETCLEKENLDNSKRLQLLIQHCFGKARDAIESCVNLPVDEGYLVAKSTLRENFGLPHIIAKAHIRKLENLRPLRQADGTSLLEFSRHLEVASRTLSGMGSEYVSDLNHMNTLRELNKKLPLSLRVKWTECAGRIISSGSRPKFADLLKFLKERAALVNNEFGEDLTPSPSKENARQRDQRARAPKMITSLTSGVSGQQRNLHRGNQSRPVCAVCHGQHGVWRCQRFKNQPIRDKWKLVQEQSLCIKCLQAGHLARSCPKTYFKCQVDGCNKEHNTLLHPPPADPSALSVNQGTLSQEGMESNVSTDSSGVASERAAVTAATGAGERVCLSVVPVKVLSKGGSLEPVETYALLDSGSEVTLCHEILQEKLGASGMKFNFTLSGMTGSTRVESEQIDLVVMSMDESVSVELSNVRTVKDMPISENCIAKRKDLENWPHLCDIELQQLDVGGVMLVIGLKEKPNLFLPMECRVGRDGEPVAVRYSLGWTVIGPVGGGDYTADRSANFLRLVENSVNCTSGLDLKDRVSHDGSRVDIAFPEGTDNGDRGIRIVPGEIYAESVCAIKETGNRSLMDEIDSQAQDEQLNRQLERLWKTDFENCEVETKVCASLEDKRALEVMEKSLRMVDGHFQVALPWRCDPPYLPNNKAVAERRGLLLKKRLQRDEALFERYKTAMAEYIEKGHAERIPKEQLQVKDRPVWYLPHHPVTHPLKPDKVRVVYDCAARYGGTSLNQQLLQGPDQTNQLVGVLSRFRQESVGVVADVEGMFLQVLVEPKDCDALRFLWWPDGNLSGEMEEYRMVKHLFGATSSPSVANFCLRKTADSCGGELETEAAETVKRNMYVDDMMKSTSTNEKAIVLVAQLRELLSRGGFRLTKWYSNAREVLTTIPESERAKSVVNLDLEKLPTETALGLKWNTEEDKFVWEASEKILQVVNQRPTTRRGMVSAIYSLFDPLGFIAPYTMKAKLMLQTLSRKRLGWDDLIEETERTQWKRWLDDLPKLGEIQVDRCFKPREFDKLDEAQLHLFSDASRQGYAAVGYLRLKDASNQIHCAFVMGKARLAPIREISIPRLELTAAVISVKLSKMIREELDVSIQRVYYWTDSMSVLKCINNESKRFHTFESNRLTVIHNGSSPSEWHYVNRDDNPADDGSKGLKLDGMLNNNRWLKGPKFLWQDESHWPGSIEIPALTDDDPEVRKEAQIYTATAQSHVLDTLVSRYSSWWKLKIAVAWLLRYRKYLQAKVELRNKNLLISSDVLAISKESPLLECGYLKVIELQEAEGEILKRVQQESFPKVMEILSSARNYKGGNCIKRVLQKAGVSLYQLNPQLMEGFLRVGGRLVNAPLAYERKHPIILPYKHQVTHLIIKHYHESLGHMGQESVLSSLRETFWVIKGRSAVRRVLRSCVDCQRRKASPGEQFMSSLPSDRLTPDKPPFTYVGVDYFGPFEVKHGRSREKRYGCLFTCLTTRAVHIEMAHSLDTDSMVNALRRFISIRGYPEQIRSDRGTNFTRADKELKETIEEWNQKKIDHVCSQKGIQWIFNPPAASHMGGIWERMIRSVRQILRAILKEQIVSDEVLSTVMAEVVNVLNSRPLTRNSDSPQDDQPLTPNHLLHLRPCPALPSNVFSKDDNNCKRAWRQAQYLANVFWRRWTREYLPTLQERRKWNETRRNLKVGDLVLLTDESFPRGKWPLGRVLEVVVSRDGLIRTAKVKTSSTVATRAKRQRKGEPVITSTTLLTRPVTKLCLLEMDGEA